MTLIIILLACLFYRFLGFPVSWWRLWVKGLHAYFVFLDHKLAKYPLWHGPTGVVLYFVSWLLLLGGVYFFVESLAGGLSVYAFQWLILIACLNPPHLARLFEDYFHAALLVDQEKMARDSSALQEGAVVVQENESGRFTVQFVLWESCRRLFAVLFWFIVLDVYGALLYSLVRDLRLTLADAEGGFFSSLQDLEALMNWPVVRLLAVCCALSGHLVAALEAWRNTSSKGLYDSEALLCEIGTAAMRNDAAALTAGDQEDSDTLMDALALMYRVLIIWLVVIAIAVCAVLMS